MRKNEKIRTEYGYGKDSILFYRGSDKKMDSLKEAAIAARKAGLGFVVKHEGPFLRTVSTVLGWDVEIMTVKQAQELFAGNDEILSELNVISRVGWPRRETIIAVSGKNSGSPYVFMMEGLNFRKVSWEDLMKEP